ncbi:MAG TPA: cysteine desulfurase family protein [Gammaproteobacteria bacterium]|nr:cysteine desulfurase family protein [Gammaproteobacteria bacterium]
MTVNNLPYFDYASSTPIDPVALQSMIECMKAKEGAFNPSNTQSNVVKNWINEARRQVAHTIDAAPENIIWTSGATESNNLAIKGAAQFYQINGKHIILSSVEHSSCIGSAQELESYGFSISYAPVDSNGTVIVEALDQLITEETILLSCQHVNNETGIIQPTNEISNWCRSKGIMLHIDAAQAIGKTPFSVKNISCDFVSLSGHKFFGPKGIGALWISDNPKRHLRSQIHGGNQENGYRSGTLSTHQIVGMGKAFSLIDQTNHEHIQRLHDQLQDPLIHRFNATINGLKGKRVPHIINATFHQHTLDSIHLLTKRIHCSQGAACKDSQSQNSHVLTAMGLSADQSKRSVRFSICKLTSIEDIKQLMKILDDTLILDKT